MRRHTGAIDSKTHRHHVVSSPFYVAVEESEDVSAGEERAAEMVLEESDSALAGGTDPDWD